jgi:hypothetical protein
MKKTEAKNQAYIKIRIMTKYAIKFFLSVSEQEAQYLNHLFPGFIAQLSFIFLCLE